MVIKATCPVCGEVDLQPANVHLVTYAQKPSLNYYYFACTNCQSDVRKDADYAVVEALKGYVDHQELTIPAEALEEHLLGPITQDEILDWVNEVLRYL